jgi:hypothetical protein
MKANLFIVGACKAGTSFLHNYLGNQDEVCPSKPKEPYFFELEKDKRDEVKYMNKYFSHRKNESFLLDGRHRNMFFKWIPELIYNYNKESKIIFILRDPVDRAFSHWWMWYSRGVIKSNFSRVIRDEKSRLKNMKLSKLTPEDYSSYINTKVPDSRIAHADFKTILESGLYYEQIQEFKKYFKEENILILDFEILKNDSHLNVKLESFLKIKFENKESAPKKINKAKEFKKINLVSSYISLLVPKKLKSYIKNKFYNKPKIKKRDEVLLKKFYQENNIKLMNDLGLSFTEKWR